MHELDLKLRPFGSQADLLLTTDHHPFDILIKINLLLKTRAPRDNQMIVPIHYYLFHHLGRYFWFSSVWPRIQKQLTQNFEPVVDDVKSIEDAVRCWLVNEKEALVISVDISTGKSNVIIYTYN